MTVSKPPILEPTYPPAIAVLVSTAGDYWGKIHYTKVVWKQYRDSPYPLGVLRLVRQGGKARWVVLQTNRHVESPKEVKARHRALQRRLLRHWLYCYEKTHC